MFSPAQSGANAYARVGIETGVMGASPHRLIAMLYEGARNAIATQAAFRGVFDDRSATLSISAPDKILHRTQFTSQALD